MRKTGKKETIAGSRHTLRTGSVIAALVTSIALFVVMLTWEKKQLADYEKGDILIAASVIPKGELLTQENLSHYLQLVQVNRQCIPATALVDMQQITERVAKTEIEPGVLLTEGMFEPLEEILAGMKNPVIAGCKAEDLYQIVGGVLRSGDRIHIYAVSGQGDAKLLWSDVFVQQVFDSAGVTIGNENHALAAQRINIYLEKEEVEQFYTALAGGSLRIVKVCG